MEQQIWKALEVLRRGGVIAYPTDTVFGLGCNALDEAAVQRVLQIKGRPAAMALPLLVPDLDMLARAAADVPRPARALAERFLPGPLTIVLRKSSWVPDWVTGGRPTVALRIPGHEIPRRLAAEMNAPLVGTSANLSGHPSATTGDEVRRRLGDVVDFVMDGICSQGIESTIVDMTESPPRIVRHGALPAERIEEALGLAVAR